MRFMLISTQVKVVVEVGVELGKNVFVSFIVNHTVQRKQNHIFSGSIIKKKALYLIKSVYLFICLVKLLDEKSEFPLIRGIPPDLK